MAFDQTGSAGVMTLDPDEVETSPTEKALDPSEVEDAPSVRQSASTQSAASSSEQSLPAGGTGPLPGIPQPQADMRVPSIGETLTGVNPDQDPKALYNYGQNAIPRAVQGAREVGRGQYIKGATDILGGVNEGMGSQVLPVGSAPAAVAKGLVGSVAGAAAAPYVVKKLGGSPDAQALAGEVGAALPLAAGVGADLLRSPRPEVLPPVRPASVEVPEVGNLLSAGEPATVDASAQPNPGPVPRSEAASPEVRYRNGQPFVQDNKTGWWQPQTANGDGSPVQADITVHKAGKVSGIDEATGLPIVDRSQPSEIPFSARGEDLPPQTGTASPMSSEAEAISARAAGSSQPDTSQQGDIQGKLASVGLNGGETNSILDMYGLDPHAENAPETALDAAGKPWDEQVRDAYSTLADQRGIPVNSNDDLFRDQNTARDARNAVEQVISHVYPEAESNTATGPSATEDTALSSETQQSSNGSARKQSITLSPDEVEDGPGASEADTARQNYGNFLDRVGTRVAMESHGQDILDRMEEAGESPREVSDKFWNETYFDLPAPVQQRFTRMLKNVSGFEPGDTIAVRPDKSSIVAKDWADVANGLLPEKAEHLEGTERGLTALMKEANDRFSDARNSTQQAPEQPRPLTGARPVLQAHNPAQSASGSLMPAQSTPSVMPVRPALTAGTARAVVSPAQIRPGVIPGSPETQSPVSLAKGDQVTLPDGSTGTVSYLDPMMRIARVRTSDGRNVSARLSALKPSGGVKQAVNQSGATVRSAPTQDLTFDPQRFQYKLNTNPQGVTDLLKGNRWNDDLAGVISVWRDPADGKTYVVNGHHRAMLAKETGTPQVAVRYLKAPDAASARAIGALQNIAEGRGTPVDAAKFFRDSGLTPADLEAKGISMGEATAANGLALSRLSPQLFDDAVSGKLRQGRAIAIGKAAPEIEQQEVLLKLIDRAEVKGKRVSDDTIEELGRMVRGAQTHSATQNTLFGAHEETRNLALEKAEVSNYIRETLGRERKLFAHVSDEGRAEQLGAAGNLIKAKTNAGIAERAGQAQELYDRLSTRVGAVNDLLDRAAAKLAKGDDSNVVKREAYTATRTALAEALNGPEAGRPQPVQVHPGRASLSPAETRNRPGAVAQVKPALPGLENAVREQSAAQAEERGRQLGNELSRPRGDIEKAAGEMERNSPLFEGSEANPQSGLFGKEKPQSQTLYSGGAVFDPEAWKTLFPDVAERFSDWVSDKEDEGDKQAAIMRETRGELDRKVSIAAKQLEKVQRDFRVRPRQDALDFFNAAEGVTPMNSIPAKDQALAATFKSYFDKMKADLQSLNPNVLRDFIENYFPHIWERPSRAATVFQQVLSGKRPFAGSGAFLRQRTIPTIQDGLALGLKPVSYNPVDLFLAKYHEMSRFLMGHKTLGMMKDAGTAKLVRPGTAPPDGWTQLDDRIGTVMSTDADGNLVIRGHYYAPAPAAKVFNAYVSKGLAGHSAIFDTLQAANNRLNALQLGISAFHATTTAVNAAASDIALGAQQITEGKPLQGMKNIAEGVTYVPSMVSTFHNGSKLMKEYLSPGSYAKFAREADAVSLAGGRIKQNTIEIKPLTQAIHDLKAGAVGSALKKTIPAIIDASSRPIMEYWVPRMKLGAFYDMAHNVLDTADREGWDDERIRSRMQTAWDSIDNRFGQMVYDNLFWNKALRDVLMASTRSVGWNAGTIRELGGAALDTVQQAGKVVSGKAPELTDRMGFAIGMTVSAGLLGSAIYYLLNGERPQTWKDAYFPGKKGEARMSIPGYMKDVVAYAHDPKQTILNKMSPVLSMLSAALENRDFYGTEIRHPDDPVVQQLWQLAKFAGAEAMPFSVRGVQKLVQQKGSLESSLSGQVREALKNPKELVAGQFGVQPAPAYIQNSPALNRAHEYDRANMPPGTRTQGQAEKQRLRAAIAVQYRSGHPDRPAIENLVREGKLTQKEVNSAITTSKTDPLVRAARPLHLDQLLNVYADADQTERRELRPIIARKAGDVRKEMDPGRRAALRAALEEVLRRGSSGQDSGSRRGVSMP